MLKRLNGKCIDQLTISNKTNKASTRKAKYKEMWETESLQFETEDLNYCLEALMSLDSNAIEKHENTLGKRWSVFIVITTKTSNQL